MPKYIYTAIDDHGWKLKDTLEAENEKALEEYLAEKGYYLLHAEEIKEVVKYKKPEVVRPEIIHDGGKSKTKEATTEPGVKELHYHQHVHYHTSEPEPPKPWSDFTIWTILWLIFFWPVGLFLLWRKKYTPQWFKIAATSCLAFWGLLYLPFSGGKPQDKPLNISFEELDAIFGTNSSYTNYQKDKLWEEYRGKYITWVGMVNYASEGLLGGFSVGFKHKAKTLNYDTLVDFRPEYKDAFTKISEGDSIRYRARLKSYCGAIMPYLLDDGSLP